MLADINRAWEMLEKAEHERELALRDELIRFASSTVLYTSTGHASWESVS